MIKIASIHPLYRKWNSLKNYGRTRKSKLCDEWIKDKSAFFSWSLSHGWVDGSRLLKENESLGHSPSNSFWAPCLRDVLVNNRIVIDRDITPKERKEIEQELHQDVVPVMIAVKRNISLKTIQVIRDSLNP